MPVNEKTFISSCVTFVVSCVFLVVSGFVAPVFADPPNWAPALEQQLQADEGCKVLYMINVKEYRLLDHDIVEARVHCTDGRNFDVIRRERQLPFEINACRPVLC